MCYLVKTVQKSRDALVAWRALQLRCQAIVEASSSAQSLCEMSVLQWCLDNAGTASGLILICESAWRNHICSDFVLVQAALSILFCFASYFGASVKSMENSAHSSGIRCGIIIMWFYSPWRLTQDIFYFVSFKMALSALFFRLGKLL